MKTTLRRTAARTCLLLLLLVAFAGCHHRDSRRRVQQNPERFTYSARLHHEWDGTSYFWNTSLEGAAVDIRLRDYTGVVRVKIFDQDEFRIFDAELDSCCFEDDERHFSFTAPAPAGVWRIRIEFIDFHGRIKIFIDEDGP